MCVCFNFAFCFVSLLSHYYYCLCSFLCFFFLWGKVLSVGCVCIVYWLMFKTLSSIDSRLWSWIKNFDSKNYYHQDPDFGDEAIFSERVSVVHILPSIGLTKQKSQTQRLIIMITLRFESRAYEHIKGERKKPHFNIPYNSIFW